MANHSVYMLPPKQPCRLPTIIRYKLAKILVLGRIIAIHLR